MMERTILPPRLKPEARAGLFRRTPPAIFPPILGLFGLGIAWRRGQDAFGIPGAPVEGVLGAVTLLFLFALAAYGVKVLRRPGVLAEDFRVLPGRAGLAALSMCLMMLAAVLVPYAPSAAALVLAAGVVVHAIGAVAALRLLLAPPDGGPRISPVSPVMQLTFVGFIVAPLAALPLGMTLFSELVLWYSLAAAALICIPGLRPLVSGTEPAPLRPLQAIHLAPAALTGSAAHLAGHPTLGAALAAVAAGLFLLLVVRARWLTEAGFSGFWSAFTFPLAAFAGVLFLTAQSLGSEAIRTLAGLVLVLATLIIPPIALRVMQLWAKGVLAQKTNAATA
jgi:tellurite resistance protein